MKIYSTHNYTFEVFDKAEAKRSRQQIATATIDAKGIKIRLNAEAYKLIKSPETVSYHFDRLNNAIGIKANNNASYLVRCRKEGFGIILGASRFIKYYNIDHKEAKKYEAILIGDMLVIELTNNAKNVSRRGKKL